jgi:imidazolonepropionase-like amidohydrolase
VSVDAPVVAIVHARVIDGTGAPAREGQTLVIRNGRIAELGDDGNVPVPSGAKVIDATGKSVIPGLIFMHEHLLYPGIENVFITTAISSTRLYLAGGVTSMRTGGASHPYADLAIKAAIDSGKAAGPWLDVTSPQLGFVHRNKGPADAAEMVNFWIDNGVTSIKLYQSLTRAEAAAAIEAAHARNVKVTGHLCGVTYHEAADLGIDNLEHMLIPASEFVPDKKPDQCPGYPRSWHETARQDPTGPAVQELLKYLVARKVAVTSTLLVMDILTAKNQPHGLDMLDPLLRAEWRRSRTSLPGGAPYPEADVLLAQQAKIAHEFVRLGGLLMAGTDPALPGIVAGFAHQQELELLVKHGGFTPIEALKVATLNPATYLGRQNEIGSIETGKQADLVLIAGDPSKRISDLYNVELVFKQGIGFDPKKLIASVKGKVGLF